MLHRQTSSNLRHTLAALALALLALLLALFPNGGRAQAATAAGPPAGSVQDVTL